MHDALPKILEKAYSADNRLVVVAGSDDEVQKLNTHLWTYQEDSWLPHGSKKDGKAEEQPIWLCSAQENPNNANILVLVGGAEADNLGAFERVLDMFDGGDAEALNKARSRWKKAKSDGHDLHYWQQNDAGSWEEKKL